MESRYSLILLELFAAVWKNIGIENPLAKLKSESLELKERDIFNLLSFAVQYNRIETVTYLDQKFELLGKVMQQPPQENLMLVNGRLFYPLQEQKDLHSNSLSGEDYGNAFVATCRTTDNQVFHYFSEKAKQFNPELIQEAFFVACLNIKPCAVTNLVNRFYTTIADSEGIGQYLSEEVENREIKKQVRTILLMKKLENSLPPKNLVWNNKTKL